MFVESHNSYEVRDSIFLQHIFKLLYFWHFYMLSFKNMRKLIVKNFSHMKKIVIFFQ